MKKIVSLLLCVLMFAGFIAAGGPVNAGAAAAELQAGGIIEYGSYPQTDVTAGMGAVLGEQEGEWISYNYYIGTGEPDGQMKPDDFMRYKDVVYEGVKYRGVRFLLSRPDTAIGKTQTYGSNQDENGYIFGNTYWFRYDPIKWRVLDPDKGLLLSDIILDSQPLNNYIIWNDVNGNGEKDKDEYFGDADCTYYACNYNESSIRKWLNNDFYNAAFSESQKSCILPTENDHNAIYEDYSQYSTESTVDNVFLLSYRDTRNEDYGFTDSNISDSTRYCTGTDYAKSQGLHVCGTSLFVGDMFANYSEWLLRSAFTASNRATIISYDGSLGLFSTSYNNYGIRPCIRIAPDAVNSNYHEQGFYRIIWDSSNSASSVYYKAGETITKPADPVKPGFAFKGWTPEIPSVMPAEDLIFTAQFEKTDILRGASVSAGSGEVYKNSVVTVTARGNNMPKGYTLVIYEGNTQVASGDNTSVSYRIPGNVSSEKTYTVKVLDADKNPQKDSGGNELTATITVTVKQGLWNNIVAFFRKLFGMNKVTI